MFAQFFGSYLLNKNYVTKEQLKEALELQKNTHLKLGVLAINAGMMSSSQVEKLHNMQAHKDMRIGDLAVEMGFVKREQIEQLFATQKTGYLQLGQALVDMKAITNTQFEEAIKSYKNNNKVEDTIKKYYSFDDENSEIYSEYISLLLRNLVRFIGDDFSPLEPVSISTCYCNAGVIQKIKGEFGMSVLIEADESILKHVAKRYANIDFSSYDDLAKSAVCEFLNLHNGLFCVNCSNSTIQKELELDLQYPLENKIFTTSEKTLEAELQYSPENRTIATNASMYLLPIYFSFGVLYFVIGQF